MELKIMKKGFGHQSNPKHIIKEIILFGEKTQILEVIN